MLEDIIMWMTDVIDRWIFRVLLLILVITMLFNTYANWVNKDFQEDTANHLDRMETVVQDIPTNQELLDVAKETLDVARKIMKRDYAEQKKQLE